MAALDRRAAVWPRAPRYGFLVVKWSLVTAGACALTYHYILTWGLWTALWFLAAPFGYGAWLHISVPPVTPPPRARGLRPR
jgi:hypothetical protein